MRNLTFVLFNKNCGDKKNELRWAQYVSVVSNIENRKIDRKACRREIKWEHVLILEWSLGTGYKNVDWIYLPHFCNL